MSERTDEERILAGIPVDVDAGPTPGAVQLLRDELRDVAADLPRIEKEIRSRRDALTASIDEQCIIRTTCDELIDAISKLSAVSR